MRIRKLVIPASLLTGLVGAAGVVAAIPIVPSQQSLILAAATEAEARGFTEQAAALADGRITDGEYSAALSRLTACMAVGDLLFAPPVLSPVDGRRYIIDVPPTGQPRGAVTILNRCVERHWDAISTLYVSFQPQVMDDRLRDAAIDCLRESGFAMTGDEANFPQMIGAPDVDGGAQREAATTCVFDAAHRLFPTLTTLTVAA